MKIYIIENKKYRVDYFRKAKDPKMLRYTLPPVAKMMSLRVQAWHPKTATAWFGSVIDLNFMRVCKFYRKTSIVFSFVSLTQSNLFCFNYRVEPVLVILCSGDRECQQN